MTLSFLRSNITTRRDSFMRAGLLFAIGLLCSLVSFAQGPAENDNAPVPTPKPTPITEHITLDERAELLKLIKSLQDRLDKLEAAQPTSAKAATESVTNAASSGLPTSPTSATPDTATTPQKAIQPDPAASSTKQDDDEKNFYGRYTPNLGFKVVNTEYGDMNVSIYTYVRYLNQLGLDNSFTDAFGNTKSVQNRQDLQLLKLQIKFLGWMFNPKFRYFLHTNMELAF